jgi:pectate lyase
MKRLGLLAAIICIYWSLSAADYCAPSSWGYAGNVTGGGNATPTFVSNESQLATALGKKNSVIIITKDITVNNHISSDKSNLTIMALPGKKLISNQQNADKSGILYLKGSNLILRNLIFEGPGAYDCDGWDNLCLDGAKNVWVDHCDFQDGVDGNFDIKGMSDNITVSWCRFRYLKAPKAGGSGGADDHRFSNLVGSGSSDKPADGTYNITYGFCWWDEGCKQRMTRCRNCLIHYLNCYWNSSVSDYYVGPENASSYFEGCTFAGKANTKKNIYKGFSGTTNYCKFVNCSGDLPSNAGTVSAPSYTYDQLTAAAAKAYVIHATCGAGATLTVTTTGEVSSSCDGGETPTPDPDPVVSDFWNISDDDFKFLGTITTETTVRGLTIAASADKAMTVSESAKTIDGKSFTHVLKTGGSGSAAARHLRFAVSGSCTIEVYLISANTSSERVLNIYSGSYGGDPLTTMPAATTAAKQTYNYTGGATTIYLGSANSGINFYGISVQYPTPTDIDNVQNESVARKVLRHGQVLILREDATYDLFGRRID